MSDILQNIAGVVPPWPIRTFSVTKSDPDVNAKSFHSSTSLALPSSYQQSNSPVR